MRSFGDLLRQSRAGLTQRLGSDFVLQLAQALGEVADPRPPFRFPERFEQRLELTVPEEEEAALLFGARRLVAAVAGWLAARSAGMRECRLLLEHRSRPDSVVDTGFAEPVCHPQRITQVLRERLERYALPAPVEAITLCVERIEPLPAVNGKLFKTAGTAVATVAEVIERLRARLGVDSVHGLHSVADYRPECASRIAPEGGGDAFAPTAPRPFWLLAAPRALAEQDGQLLMRQGPLRLLGSTERIESGWWDAGEAGAVGDVRRDYFVAQATTGEILWIYRDRAGWWLHGLFG